MWAQKEGRSERSRAGTKGERGDKENWYLTENPTATQLDPGGGEEKVGQREEMMGQQKQTKDPPATQADRENVRSWTNRSVCRGYALSTI